MNDYAVITTHGSLGFGTGPWRHEVGPPGPVLVSLHPAMPMAGFVNDDGFRLGLDRNMRGGPMLIALGAGIQPYAGPVVVTGWHGRTGDTCPLRPIDVELLTRLHADVGNALTEQPRADDSSVRPGAWPGWAEDVRRIAEEITGGPAPTMQILES